MSRYLSHLAEAAVCGLVVGAVFGAATLMWWVTP